MYLAVCPLLGTGHGRSVGEWMNLTVCPLHGTSLDSSVGEWMNLTVCALQSLSSTPGQWHYVTVPTVAEYFKGFCPGCPATQSGASVSKIFPNGTAHHQEGRLKSEANQMDGQWLKRNAHTAFVYISWQNQLLGSRNILKHEFVTADEIERAMSWPNMFSLVFRFWSLPWTNGPNIQLKWKLK